ncbi:hypothetical protein FRC11_005674 [Ceratobasidium sp. 423]|nr:hypothetical protein FRC11_005674 [Ceratobasidium sp. 423]
MAPSQIERKTIFSEKTLTKKGLCPVTVIQGQEPAFESHSLYYELHGSGPEKIACIMGLTFAKDPAVVAQMVMEMVLPLSWLTEPSATDPKVTNREAQTRLYLSRLLVTRKQTLMGTLSQMAAGLSHRVTPERLCQIANDIPTIALVTGDEDNLVPPERSEWIKQCMGPNVKLEKWKHTGHALQIQRPEKFNALVERVIEESRGL